MVSPHKLPGFHKEQTPLQKTLSLAYVLVMANIGYNSHRIRDYVVDKYFKNPPEKQSSSHFAPYTVTPEENPFITNLLPSNTIPLSKDLEGRILFTNLSPSAVNPLVNSRYSHIDYIDVDGNDTLECVTFLDVDKHKKMLRLEYKHNDIVITSLKDI